MHEGSVYPPCVCGQLGSRAGSGVPAHAELCLFSLQLPDLPLAVSIAGANFTSAACVVIHFC